MATVSGELKEFHKVTLDFAGPQATETASTFTDHRLDVAFTHQTTGETRVVPGYFAADGDAANTSAAEGNVWRVHFAPPDDGDWAYSASFRTGANVAAAAAPGGGTSAGFMDGETGSFSIARTDKTGDDVRGRGFLQYVGENHYRFSGDGAYFLKTGVGSPENLLAYAGFDGTTPTHAYAPHVEDWREGDPTWRGGEGKGIIGFVNAVAGYGQNALYFLTMNVQGDSKDVWPWTTQTDRTTYDVSKLDQWGVVMDQMSRKGVMLHVVHQEQENDQLLDGGALGVESSVYYRELIARFGHSPALQWNLGEENTNTDAERKAFATFIKAVDPYDHPIVVHTHTTVQTKRYGPLMGFDEVDGASLQTYQPHAKTVEWVTKSNATDRPWVVSMDEIAYLNPDGSQNHETGTPPDSVDFDHDVIRKQYLWGNLVGGGAGAEFYFAKWPGDGDRDAEQVDSRAEMWRQAVVAREFFENYVPFWRMNPNDALTSAGDDFVLAERGQTYLVYLPAGGTTSLNLTGLGGSFSVDWFDPKSGGVLQQGSVAALEGGGVVGLGAPPDQPTEDWAVLIRRTDDGPPPAPLPMPSLLDAADALAGTTGSQTWGGVGIGGKSPAGRETGVAFTSNRDGIGVKKGPGGVQLGFDPATGRSEALTIDFGSGVDSAVVTLGRVNAGFADSATWRAYGAGGAEVGSGDMSAANGRQIGSISYSYDVAPAADFRSLILTANANNGSGTAYVLGAVEYVIH